MTLPATSSSVPAGAPAPAVDVDTLRDVLGRFATGVAVLVTGRGRDAHGMTCSAFASVSGRPSLVLACLRNESRFLALLRDVGCFSATILGEGHDRLASWFASRDRPADARQFHGVACSRGSATGCLVLEVGIGRLECRVEAMHEAGDHHIVVGEVLTASHRPGRPLVRYARGFHALASVRPRASRANARAPRP